MRKSQSFREIGKSWMQKLKFFWILLDFSSSFEESELDKKKESHQNLRWFLGLMDFLISCLGDHFVCLIYKPSSVHWLQIVWVNILTKYASSIIIINIKIQSPWGISTFCTMLLPSYYENAMVVATSEVSPEYHVVSVLLLQVDA